MECSINTAAVSATYLCPVPVTVYKYNQPPDLGTFRHCHPHRTQQVQRHPINVCILVYNHLLLKFCKYSKYECCRPTMALLLVTLCLLVSLASCQHPSHYSPLVVQPRTNTAAAE